MRFHGLRLSFFSEKRMESRQRKKTPPHHCGLKNWLVTTLRATRSLRSLKQALRLTPPANFSPFGHRPPFKGAGSCTSACLCRAFLRMHIPHEDVLSHGGAGPHSKAFPSLMPGEVSRRVQERSLMIAKPLTRKRTHIRGKMFCTGTDEAVCLFSGNKKSGRLSAFGFSSRRNLCR